MKRLLAWLACLAVQVAAAQADAVPGHYQLQGVREVGAEMVLASDGRFSFDLAYGGVDQQARGRWTLQAGKVVLQPDPPPATGFTLGPLSAEPLEPYRSEGDRPTLLVVRVSTPALGQAWSGMELSAEFSNGQVRTGTTTGRGMLGFEQRTAPPWAGATVRRLGVAYPAGGVATRWFDIDNARVQGVEIHFEPGALVAPAFTRAVLLRGRADDGRVLRVESGDLGRPGWRFVAQP